MASARVPALRRPRLAIAPERLESCLRRLDPADRALLDLSLNRGIPDASMAPILRTDPMRLAWRRARAIERVASRLGLYEPADLAEVRAALTRLPDRAWLPLELQAARVPPRLEPPEPAGAEIRVFVPARPTSHSRALAPRGTPPGGARRGGLGRRFAVRASLARPRARTLARGAAGAVLVGAAAALALRRGSR